jgi:hypothetical protein
MDTMTPSGSIDLRLAAAAAAQEAGTESYRHLPSHHASWCAQHTLNGCLGEELTLPESRVTVWLCRGPGGEDHLVVDYPGGNLEFVIPS